MSQSVALFLWNCIWVTQHAVERSLTTNVSKLLLKTHICNIYISVWSKVSLGSLAIFRDSLPQIPKFVFCFVLLSIEKKKNCWTFEDVSLFCNMRGHRLVSFPALFSLPSCVPNYFDFIKWWDVFFTTAMFSTKHFAGEDAKKKIYGRTKLSHIWFWLMLHPANCRSRAGISFPDCWSPKP